MDICAALTIANPRDSIANLDDDEKGVGITDTLGGQQSLAIINEAGLYSLILRSRKPEAKAFKRWITHEVLPQIRKTGGYGQTDDKMALALTGITEMLKSIHEGQEALAKRVTALEERPKAALPRSQEPQVPEPKVTQKMRCQDWLRIYLEEGPVCVDLIVSEAFLNGYRKSTLYAASSAIGVTSSTNPQDLKEGRGRRPAWWAPRGFNWKSFWMGVEHGEGQSPWRRELPIESLFNPISE